ncbi:site-specific DNA-methyltransferase [Tenacibaculum finnmarkense]|uniref:site-specific DNA-methyltransferase n=1 Tax=Tenacibaculum finnmarkense TaxID=2781243 RepID=UPI001EFC187A|nr:site-specific DNA-methyltransferase [Tenacibaculum finnmarkense]MCG8208178.1 site-specific DNA-methyltransferase [Tenacibaculum finnmarkense genomovar finnmarkense]MCG8724051.1 site-specific DNA-methyltransferase [Tenacibaculum finnmarkense]MCG8742369.1 site-specific DNA-methyltransferase [Tenacibaculum finnmarkense]MCG8765763.1 site-specific DNA-methyltransferase [Tenacibaculum finnmarkense]MCG8778979.1 site-specific DNA-methyltransferase [Tenacibaculum finnmarkense]
MSIHKIQQGDNLTKSKNLVADNIDKLKELFPEIVTEGKIDFKVLQDVLGENIEEEDEYYRFTWAGKAQARQEAHKPSTGTLRPVKEDSVDWDTTENVYIEGDNLEVLKLLQKSYAGKVKMIYIDPPYNTGKDFVYKDNYKDNLKNYQEVTGQVDSEGNKLSTNSDSDGRYHSNWLNMMYPRLRLARNLLKEDGVIFMSIDDNEVENLKKLGNEIFGEENFITTFQWKRKKEISSDSKNVSIQGEYILAFGKSQSVLLNSEELSKEYVDKSYKDSNNFFPKGKWRPVPITVSKGLSGGGYEYEITNPNGTKHNKLWAYPQKSYEDLVLKGIVYFGVDGKSIPQKVIYAHESKGQPTTNYWDNTASNKEGKKQVLDLFNGGNIFDTPKPVKLINRLLNLCINNHNDIVLDFFSGSGSTAHATMKMNITDEGNRKYIQVQLPEKTNEKSEAFKAGYKTIAEIGKERIRRAGKKIAEENPEKAKDLDLGFKVFKLDSSNIKSWDGNPDNLQEELFDAVSNIKTDRTEEDVLYEILLKYGLDLTLPIEEKIIEGKTVFNVGFGALFICLGDNLTNKVASGIGAWKEELQPEICRVIFKDTGFTDVEKTNSIQTLKRFGITEIKSI